MIRILSLVLFHWYLTILIQEIQCYFVIFYFYTYLCHIYFIFFQLYPYISYKIVYIYQFYGLFLYCKIIESADIKYSLYGILLFLDKTK